MIERWFAWGIEQVMRVYEPQVRERKRAMFAEVRGTVVEIGPGTGPNLPYLVHCDRYIGIEPNRHMHPYLQRKAQRLGMDVELLTIGAEGIPLPDGCADYVVGTLVLCSVTDVDQVLREIRRILRPGGSYLFVEHVAAPRGTRTAVLQRLIKPLWCCCAVGCHVDRETWHPLCAAGFAHLDYEHFRVRLPVVSPHISGRAVV